MTQYAQFHLPPHSWVSLSLLSDFLLLKRNYFFCRESETSSKPERKIKHRKELGTYRLHKCSRSCLVFHFTSWETLLQPQGVREKGTNSATTYTIPHKRKNSCSRSWSSILMWSSRTRQPDSTGGLQSFSEFGTWFLPRDCLNLGWAHMKLFRGAQHKKPCQHLFTEKQRQHIRTREWSSCLAQEIQTVLSLTAPCPPWLLTCETGATLPLGNVLSTWNWCGIASDYYLLLLTVDTPQLGNLRNAHMDVWPRRKLNCTLFGPQASYGAWEMG